MSDDLGLALRQAVGRDCPACGHLNPSQATNCEECAGALPVPAEERSVDLREGAMLYHKIPLDEAWNLKRLRVALEGIENGTLTLDDYRLHVSAVLQVAQEGLEFFEANLGQLDTEVLDPSTVAMVEATVEHWNGFHQGCERMMACQEGPWDEARAGYDQVYQAIAGLDALEDQATDTLRALHEAIEADDDDDDDEDEGDEDFTSEGADETDQD